MARSYKFCLVQFPAHPLRDERLNLGIAIFQDDRLDVRASRRLEKLKAISGALDIDQVRDSIGGLELLDASLRDANSGPMDRYAALKEIAAFQFTSLGEFMAPDNESYERQVSNLLTRLVEPEPAPLKAFNKKPTGLLRSIKSALKIERVLAKKGEDIDAHRVVSNYQIAEGLSADLILKNGAMHIIETVDASSAEGHLIRAVQRVAISALVFEHARMNYGKQQTSAKLVYAASSALESAISPSLRAAEHQGAILINWESNDDKRRLIADLARLATPLEKSNKKQSLAIDASAQHKFRLN